MGPTCLIRSCISEYTVRNACRWTFLCICNGRCLFMPYVFSTTPPHNVPGLWQPCHASCQYDSISPKGHIKPLPHDHPGCWCFHIRFATLFSVSFAPEHTVSPETHHNIINLSQSSHGEKDFLIVLQHYLVHIHLLKPPTGFRLCCDNIVNLLLNIYNESWWSV